MKFKVDIVSDVVCPWCYVGKKRFEKAAEQLEGIEFDVTYLPYQLHPDVGPEGMDLREYLEDKYGREGQVDDMQNRVSAVAKEQGIEMDFTKGQRLPNTLKAHALMESLKDKDQKATLNEAYLSAYFEHGKDLGDIDELISIAGELGISFEGLDLSEEHIQGVLDLESEQKQKGVRAVPTFIINDKWMVQGAQPTETFIQVFKDLEQRVQEELNAPACEPGCDC